MPLASFIGFTGTPIELADAGTGAVLGDYISACDIQRAVPDDAAGGGGGVSPPPARYIPRMAGAPRFPPSQRRRS